MIKAMKYVVVFLLIAIALVLVLFRVEGFFGIVGPGERLQRHYALRETKNISSKIHNLRQSKDPNADLEIVHMMESGVVEGQNISLALYALGEMRSERSVDSIVSAMRQNDNRTHEPQVAISGAEALAKIGGARAQATLQEFYELSQRTDNAHWYLKVMDADKAIKKALEQIASHNQAL